jgi:hypothetical protein
MGIMTVLKEKLSYSKLEEPVSEYTKLKSNVMRSVSSFDFLKELKIYREAV